MKYFSLVSAFKELQKTYCSKRSVSYKCRLDLSYSLTKYMKHSNKDQGIVMSSKLAECSIKKETQYFFVNVLANGACQSNSILLNFSQPCYMFNCGEGTQRIWKEYNLKLTKNKVIFVTHNTWKNIGGIMGLALTYQSQGNRELTVYGPPTIMEIIKASQNFISLKTLQINVKTIETEGSYDDSYINVKFVPLYPESLNNCVSDISATEQNSVDEIHPPPSKKKRNFSEKGSQNNIVSCYICETTEMGVHLDSQICKDKGIPVGPILGVLKSKKDVILEDGRCIRWQDVVSNTGETKIILVVDCPTEDYLDSLINKKEFLQFQNSPEKAAHLVIHFTPPEIMKMKKYGEWMARFPPVTKHLKINSDNAVLDHCDVYRVQEKLNHIYPVLFPKMSGNNIPRVKKDLSGIVDRHKTNTFFFGDEEQQCQTKLDNPSISVTEGIHGREFFESDLNIRENINGMQVYNGAATLKFIYHPKKPYEISHSLFFDPVQDINEVISVENFNELLAELKEYIAKWESSDTYKKLPEYPKVCFLGTGSSEPQKLRNCSGILVEISDDVWMLMDGGEGTYGQLLRFFGKENLPEVIRKIKVIYVSHHHADHHLGLINYLHARSQLMEDVGNESKNQESAMKHLLMILPHRVKDWMLMYSRTFPSVLKGVDILVNAELMWPSNSVATLINNLGLKSLRTVSVHHVQDSFGVSIVDPNGFKITYSGDCRPCDNLVSLGEDSDLLIHEATFEDGLREMALCKKHSTVSEAIEVGKKMRAKFTLLTHFSQRYSHVPNLNFDMMDDVGIAFDNMRVGPREIPVLPRLIKLFKLIFADKISLLEQKTMLRDMKRSRERSLIKRLAALNN